MRITDLLDIRSIALDAAPKSKQETLDAAVALMVKDHRRRCVPRTGLRKRRREHHRNRRGNCDSARKM